MLTKSLAAYVILRSKEPVSEVINDLFEIEIEAASLVGSLYSDDKRTVNLKVSLASVFSFVPIGGRKLEKDVTPKKPKALPHHSSAQKKKSLRFKKSRASSPAKKSHSPISLKRRTQSSHERTRSRP